MSARDVRLTVADPKTAAGPVRVAAAGLALRLGLAYQQVEDLRIAMDEAVALAASYCEGSLVVTYDMGDGGLTIRLKSESPDCPAPSSAAVNQFLQMVEDLVTAASVADGTITLRITSS